MSMTNKYPLKKEERFVHYYVGAEYDIDAKTIGELRAYLEQILDDISEEDHLEIEEIHCKGTKISYLLKKAIPQ